MELSARDRDDVTRLGAALPPPEPEIRAVVIVPAHDEEERIGRCLAALASQVEVGPEEFEIVVVLDACTDDTAAVVASTRADLRVDGPKTPDIEDFSAHQHLGSADRDEV